MALYTLKDFAELVHRKLAHVSTDKTRNKIVVDAAGMVDDKNPTNFAYIQKWQLAKGIVAAEQPATQSFTQKEAVAQTKPTRPAEEGEKPRRPDAVGSIFQLDIEKKKLDIEDLQEKIEINRIKKEKLQGQVIPTTLVTDLFTQHTASITTAFLQTIESHLSDIAKEKNITPEDVVIYRHALTGYLNTAIKASIASTKAELKSIIQIYSTKLSAGEKK